MIFRRGDKSADVLHFLQEPLGSLGYAIDCDGIFLGQTESFVRRFQADRGLPVTGVADERTLTRLWDLTETRRKWPLLIDTGAPFPAMSAAKRAAVFGRFDFQPAEGDSIRILGGWQGKNIQKFYIPQLDGVPYYTVGNSLKCSGYVNLHRLAGPIFQRFFARVEDAGLLDRVRTFDGAFVARYVRGSRTALSNHSWGTALDINAYANGLGKTPAAAGRDGSVVELVPLAHECGLYWGGNFSRRDGMHFEVAVIN